MKRSRKPSMAALIDILKSQAHKSENRDWSGFEEHVQRVYQRLLDLKGEDVLVARDVTIRGRNGLEHQIDVYYEFELTGLRHRVAIECKNMQRPVDKDRVLAFSAKISDCPGVRGCMIAANGYQSGAKKFADDNGITALTRDDLPSLGTLLGMRLEMVAIPSETSIGQPFWTLYELETGAPAGHLENGETYGLLFFSKKQAEAFFKFRSYGPAWAVRGLSQENLRAFILTVDAMDGRYLITQVMELPDGTCDVAGQEIERKMLISEFYHGSGTIPEEPMVMPSIRERRAART
ncbi:restriction endonuclease [Ralstonia solanacearum]|uniref:restriction endonuclease n=1 Tax=Ralstonia solanacearum TaxID=305 RepID=UPI0018D12F94|nr:restriction endonuclease [Ralstonia solanacearum]